MLHSTFKRKPRKRVVSRSFRVTPEIDRELGQAAREKDCSKSWLIVDIIKGWLAFRRAKEKVE